MKEVIELSEETKNLMKGTGTVVCTGIGADKQPLYMNLPYWYKETDKPNVYEVFFPNNLPKDLSEALHEGPISQHVSNYEAFVTNHMQPVLRKHDRLFGLLEAGTISKEEMADLDRISPIVHAFVQADKSVREIIKVAQKG